MESATVLYIPKEGADIPIDVAAKNKELVQRLDSKLKKSLKKYFFKNIELIFFSKLSRCYSLVKAT